MPRAGGAAKSGGKGGLLVGIIVVIVILAGAGVAGYFWNRSSSISTAQQYMDAAMAIFKTGQLDVEGLKRVLVKEQVAEIEQAQGPLFDMANSPMGKFLTSLKASYEMGEAKAGMKEATVNVKVTMAFGTQSFSRDMKVALVREGLAWKVDSRKTQASAGGGGAPKL
jgi:flagellar basal body-associated protein FliL